MLLRFERMLILGLLASLSVISAEAGNRELIDNRVQELDELNKQIVDQIEGVPSHGRIELKAHVTVQGETPVVEFLEQKITVKEEAIDFKSGNVTASPKEEFNEKEQHK